MKIRTETPADFNAVLDFVDQAFKTAYVSDGLEQEMVYQVHQSDRYIPELTFIGEIDEKIIGFIMISHTIIKNENGDFKTLLLGPVCVKHSYRNNGLGGILIKTAIKDAIALGYGSVFLAGDRNYYSRFGFQPASGFGIKCQYDLPPELRDNIMCMELLPGALTGISGTVIL